MIVLMWRNGLINSKHLYRTIIPEILNKPVLLYTGTCDRYSTTCIPLLINMINNDGQCCDNKMRGTRRLAEFWNNFPGKTGEETSTRQTWTVELMGGLCVHTTLCHVNALGHVGPVMFMYTCISRFMCKDKQCQSQGICHRKISEVNAVVALFRAKPESG